MTPFSAIYKVVARQYGNSAEFVIDIPCHTDKIMELKEAVELAHYNANRVFNYSGLGDRPTVSVKKQV